ncbi:MAG: hypothetical protein WAK93_21265 [Solirubrobacteraceae bacterium]
MAVIRIRCSIGGATLRPAARRREPGFDAFGLFDPFDLFGPFDPFDAFEAAGGAI